jgi:hypothetical protein
MNQAVNAVPHLRALGSKGGLARARTTPAAQAII